MSATMGPLSGENQHSASGNSQPLVTSALFPTTTNKQFGGLGNSSDLSQRNKGQTGGLVFNGFTWVTPEELININPFTKRRRVGNTRVAAIQHVQQIKKENPFMMAFPTNGSSQAVMPPRSLSEIEQKILETQSSLSAMVHTRSQMECTPGSAGKTEWQGGQESQMSNLDPNRKRKTGGSRWDSSSGAPDYSSGPGQPQFNANHVPFGPPQFSENNGDFVPPGFGGNSFNLGPPQFSASNISFCPPGFSASNAPHFPPQLNGNNVRFGQPQFNTFGVPFDPQQFNACNIPQNYGNNSPFRPHLFDANLPFRPPQFNPNNPAYRPPFDANNGGFHGTSTVVHHEPINFRNMDVPGVGHSDERRSALSDIDRKIQEARDRLKALDQIQKEVVEMLETAESTSKETAERKGNQVPESTTGIYNRVASWDVDPPGTGVDKDYSRGYCDERFSSNENNREYSPIRSNLDSQRFVSSETYDKELEGRFGANSTSRDFCSDKRDDEQRSLSSVSAGEFSPRGVSDINDRNYSPFEREDPAIGSRYSNFKDHPNQGRRSPEESRGRRFSAEQRYRSEGGSPESRENRFTYDSVSPEDMYLSNNSFPTTLKSWESGSREPYQGTFGGFRPQSNNFLMPTSQSGLQTSGFTPSENSSSNKITWAKFLHGSTNQSGKSFYSGEKDPFDRHDEESSEHGSFDVQHGPTSKTGPGSATNYNRDSKEHGFVNPRRMSRDNSPIQRRLPSPSRKQETGRSHGYVSQTEEDRLQVLLGSKEERSEHLVGLARKAKNNPEASRQGLAVRLSQHEMKYLVDKFDLQPETVIGILCDEDVIYDNRFKDLVRTLMMDDNVGEHRSKRRPPKRRDWNCRNCKSFNYRQFTECKRCGRERTYPKVKEDESP